MDMEQLLLGDAPLLKIQVTYCGDYQTLLGITVARVLTGMQACAHDTDSIRENEVLDSAVLCYRVHVRDRLLLCNCSAKVVDTAVMLMTAMQTLLDW